ncbi:hypothetical protein KHQ88_02700 [Mycoplasmatota bacterium]|nr:hypothetical protein KHQ88_02700 [Mycoplasmatota bacterium]
MELKTTDITKIDYNNHRFSLTNGQLFLLGVLEENAIKDTPILKAEVGLENKVLFNPLFSILKVNDQFLSPKLHKPIHHSQTYRIEEDVLYRETSYVIDGVKITVSSERFLDHKDMLIYTQYNFKTSHPVNIDFFHGIDDTSIHNTQGVNYIKSKLHEISMKTKVDDYLVLMYNKNFRHKNYNQKNEPTEHYKITTEANRQYTITKMIGYGPRIRELKKLINYKMNQSYDKLKEEHIISKTALLEENKMTIVNNRKVDFLLKYVYRQHFNQYSSLNSTNQTGIEDYTRIIFYLYNKPQFAKNILLTKLAKFKEYKGFAEMIGYKGAFVTNNIQDFTIGHRLIYEGALFIYLFNMYEEMTLDKSMHREYLHLSIDICRFYMSYASLNENQSHYNFNNVSNANKSLNHINNHTLTNYLIKNALFITRSILNKCINDEKCDEYNVNNDSTFIKELKTFEKKIYVQKPDINHLIYPYQDFKKDIHNSRLEINDNKNIILFDQLYLFILFSDLYSKKMINAHIKYYSRFTSKKSLNYILLKMISNDIISSDEIEELVRTLSLKKESLMINHKGIDLGIQGLLYIFMIHRLSGLRFSGTHFMVDSLLPRNIRRVEFNIKYKSYSGHIKIKRNSAHLYWSN